MQQLIKVTIKITTIRNIVVHCAIQLSRDSGSAQDSFVQLSQTERMRGLFPALSRTSCECEHSEPTRKQSTVLTVCALLWLVLYVPFYSLSDQHGSTTADNDDSDVVDIEQLITLMSENLYLGQNNGLPLFCPKYKYSLHSLEQK